MAEESQKTAEQVEVVVEKQTTEREPPPQPEDEPEVAPPVEKPVVVQETTATTDDDVIEAKEAPVAAAEAAATEEEKITQSVSFKEETNVVGDLPDPEKKALDELKLLIQEALNKHEFTTPPPAAEEKEEKEETPAPAVTTTTTEEEPKPEEKTEIVAEVPKEAPETEIATPPPPPPPPVEGKEEEKVEEAVESVVVVETVPAPKIDEDGAKTVEAIEETIVAVSAPPPEESAPELPPPPPEEVFIWGIPLVGDTEKTDVILLKFLRARDFKVKEALGMIKNTVRWRKEFGIEALLEEDLEKKDLDKVVFTHGFDKEGHPVCYNVYGEFQDKDLYNNNFSDEEKRLKFLKWRIQFLEKSIRKLEFTPNGVCTIVQVNDLKNSPGPHRRELRQATNQALQLLQDNYPEFVAKQVFVNVPWWYLAFHRMISPFLTQRTKSKFVFAGPSRTADTLFKYIAPEQVPVQYGGLSREGEQEFTVADATTEVTIKPATKHTVEFPVSESCFLVWELRVVGWDVSYGAEFVPSAEDGYTVIVQKTRKIAQTDEPVICNSFKIGESGMVVLTIDNQSSKKKKLLYRFKTKSSSD